MYFQIITSKKVITFEEIVILKEVLSSTQVFNSCIVDKIKNLGIIRAYEKSYLIEQVWNNNDKNFMLI